MMDNFRIECRLAVLYLVSTVLATVTTVTSVVPWDHWREILDTCSGPRCGCILRCSSSFNFFHGGGNRICHFAVFASVPVICVSAVMASYHGYRVCTATRKVRRPKNRRRNVDVEAVNSPIEMKSSLCECWIPLALLASSVTILLIANGSVLTEGFYKTCREYRKALVKILLVTGTSADVIYNRLSCGAIYDFMDYLEPVTRPFIRKDDIDYTQPHQEHDFSRGQFIETALSLQIAIVTVWLNCGLWVVICIHNILLAKKSETRCCRCL